MERAHRAHPDVHRVGGQPKELHFFDGPGSALRRAGRHALRALLPAAGGRHHRRVDARLHDRLLDARADRAGGARGAHPGPAARPDRAVPERPDATRWRPRARRSSHRDVPGAFQRGLYAPQLRRVLDAFPREQVLVQQYEACRDDPARELARTFAFLGLAPFEPDAAPPPGRGQPHHGRALRASASLRAALLDGYAPDLEQLRDLAPGLDLSLWPTAREVGLA